MIKILFRLDASNAIGTGHLMRMLTLADALVQQGHMHAEEVQCGFYCYELPEALARLIAQSGHQHLSADALFADVAFIGQWQADWVVVDHYLLDRRWEEQASQYAGVFIIDDLADRLHHGVALLDQGPLRTPDDYAAQVNTDCKLLLGAQYALLRPEYSALKKSQTPPFNRGLICFGGADPAHATLTTLKSLIKLPRAQTVHWQVIAGAANEDWGELQQLTQQCALNVTLKRHEPHMATQLASADFAIGAAGGMTWERCCIGIPTVAVPIVDNQVFNDEVIAQYRLAERLTLAQLAQPLAIEHALKKLAHDSEGFRHRAQAMIDGYGATRVADYLLGIQPS